MGMSKYCFVSVLSGGVCSVVHESGQTPATNSVHSRASGKPVQRIPNNLLSWVPAFAGTNGLGWYSVTRNYSAFGPIFIYQSAICEPVQNRPSPFLRIFS